MAVSKQIYEEGREILYGRTFEVKLRYKYFKLCTLDFNAWVLRRAQEEELCRLVRNIERIQLILHTERIKGEIDDRNRDVRANMKANFNYLVEVLRQAPRLQHLHIFIIDGLPFIRRPNPDVPLHWLLRPFETLRGLETVQIVSGESKVFELEQHM